MAEAQPEYPDSDFSEDNDQTPLDITFNKAADHVKKLVSTLNDSQLLELYALFKQATEGVCNTPRPGWLDMKGSKKWDTWKSLGGMPSEEAKGKYIKLVEKYDPNWCEPTGAQKESKQTWMAVSSLQYSPEPELNHSELSLLDAAREDCGDRITELLSNNPELKNEKDEDGLTVLHWAADRDATKALTAAINSGCPINAVDNCGQTALHYAASCGHLTSTRILIESGASLIKDHEDNTPFDLATDEEIKKLLEGANH